MGLLWDVCRDGSECGASCTERVPAPSPDWSSSSAKMEGVWRRTTRVCANSWNTRRYLVCSENIKNLCEDLTRLMVLILQVIRLADCIRVSEVEMDGCPRDTLPFVIETTEKIYVFAADRQQLDDWTHRLCEVAFPVGTQHTQFL